ncbi:MAG: hypothetical protein DSZ05_08020 [Sulfurospirillum sp.]|nr:MAG: hypothetical protein DSZ05_08020 [Sulfurospirillum sp.]
MRIFTKSSIVLAAVAALALSGCAEKKVCNTPVAKIAKVDNRDAEIKSLQAELAEARAKSAKVVTVTKTVQGPNELYPPNPEPGKCYARVLTPAKYQIKTEKVLVREPGEKVVVIPAKYGWKTQKVLVKEASEKIVSVPPVYKTVTEKILVKPASEKLVTVPAVYKTVTEKILVKPAMTTWKKGRGLTEKLDGNTGEIMCLVETPPVYKTITKKVLVKPATTKSIPVPAVYKTITKRVVARPASTKTIPIPAVYKTIRVKTIVQPAQTKTIPVPPVYKTVTKKIKVADPVLKWKVVRCRTIVH